MWRSPMTAYIRFGRWQRAMLGFAIALSLAGTVSVGAEVSAAASPRSAGRGTRPRAGKKADAAVIARKAVEVAEEQPPRCREFSLRLSSSNNLALVLRMDRKYADAEPPVKRALSIREAEFGAQHPDICQSLSNLAVLFESAGRLADVEPLFQRSLTIREQAWGAAHPAVGHSLHELAKLYRQMGRKQEGDTYFKRAVAVLGSGHPAVALDALAPGDFEAAALMLNAADQSDPRGAVRKTFSGKSPSCDGQACA